MPSSTRRAHRREAWKSRYRPLQLQVFSYAGHHRDTIGLMTECDSKTQIEVADRGGGHYLPLMSLLHRWHRSRPETSRSTSCAFCQARISTTSDPCECTLQKGYWEQARAQCFSGQRKPPWLLCDDPDFHEAGRSCTPRSREPGTCFQQLSGGGLARLGALATGDEGQAAM